MIIYIHICRDPRTYVNEPRSNPPHDEWWVESFIHKFIEWTTHCKWYNKWSRSFANSFTNVNEWSRACGWVMSHMWMGHDAHMKTAHPHVRHDPFTCVTWPIHMSEMTVFIWTSWPIHMCDMTHPHARLHSFTFVNEFANERLHLLYHLQCVVHSMNLWMNDSIHHSSWGFFMGVRRRLNVDNST